MTVKLAIQPRTTVPENAAEFISAVVYGPKFPSTPIFVNKKAFDKTFKEAGESVIIELEGLDKPVDVLIKEVAFSPVKGGINHVDFYALDKDNEITTDIQLHFVNEAPAAKLGAVVNKVLHEVTVTCKPADLPAHLDVDLGLLKDVESKIHVSDIVCPKGVKIEQDADDMVALSEVIADEVESEEPVIAAADVPVEKKGKAEEEESEAAE